MARYVVVHATDILAIIDTSTPETYDLSSYPSGSVLVADPNSLGQIGGYYSGGSFIPSSQIYGDSRATTGTAILDYGIIPTFSASVFVDGQANILATSKVQVWFQADTTDIGAEYNSASDHLLASQYVKLTSGEPVAEDGFLIFAESRKFLWSGKYRVRWSWSQ